MKIALTIVFWLGVLGACCWVYTKLPGVWDTNEDTDPNRLGGSDEDGSWGNDD